MHCQNDTHAALLGAIIAIAIMNFTFIIISGLLMRATLRRESAKIRAVVRSAISKALQIVGDELDATKAEQGIREQIQETLIRPDPRHLRIARNKR